MDEKLPVVEGNDSEDKLSNQSTLPPPAERDCVLEGSPRQGSSELSHGILSIKTEEKEEEATEVELWCSQQ
jgi:hypothetical protein